MARYNYDCIYECGDEECGKCFLKGIIFECPATCEAYISHIKSPEEVREKISHEIRLSDKRN